VAVTGIHALFYTSEPDALRAFIRDKLGFPYTDTGGGWLIFDAPSADLAVHPSDVVAHEISFFCDDIEATVADLRTKGVEFTTGIQDEDWGRLIHFEMPGGVATLLYEPKYTK
jgi:hypothetical protein